MKKILWLCNSTFSDNSIKATGGWLQPLAEMLQKKSEIQIINITRGNVDVVTQINHSDIIQYIIPIRKELKNNQYATKETCLEVKKIIDKINPDIVHIWGTENIWASIYQQGYITCKTIIDIQGLLFACADYFYGGLTNSEIMQSIHLKEILMPWRCLFWKKHIFSKRGKIELQCLKQFENIAFQSNWVYHQIKSINKKANYFNSKIILRDSFYSTTPWEYTTTSAPIIFSSASSAISYKGVHVLIKAIAILKQKYPNIQLRLAGKINVGNKLLDGYSIFLKKLIKKLDLEKNVIYLGSINEDQIISELKNCNVCVVTSFIETYCLAFAESMIVGTPTVVSYAGAMPELADNEIEAIFYNSIDYRDCAAKIERLINDKELAEKISNNCRNRRLKENNRKAVIDNQIKIYEALLESTNADMNQ